jgi:hypothetical protein
MEDNNVTPPAGSDFARWWNVVIVVLTGIQTVFLNVFLASSLIFFVVTREAAQLQITQIIGVSKYAILFLALLITWIVSGLISGIKGVTTLVALVRKVKFKDDE